MPPKGKGKGGKQEKGSEEGGKEKGGGGNKAKCRHILCEKNAKVLEAYAKLQEGTPFNQVAQQYSEDKAKEGGNLGWLIRGGMAGPFQERAFSQPIGKYGEPFKTVHGYHILLVEGRSN